MELIQTLYNIIQIPASADTGYPQYDTNKIHFKLPTDIKTVKVDFNLLLTNFDVKDIHSVYWHFGDPYAVNDNVNQTTKQNLTGTSHNYTQNGMYDLNCIINTSTYTVHLNKKVSICLNNPKFYAFPIIKPEDFPNNYFMNLYCYDPQALIYYTNNELSWTQYTSTVSGNATDIAFLYYAKYSDGTQSIVYAEPISDKIEVDLLDVYSPTLYHTYIIPSEIEPVTIPVAWSSSEVHLYSSGITAVGVSGQDYNLEKAVKIRFVNNKSNLCSFENYNIIYANIHGYNNGQLVRFYSFNSETPIRTDVVSGTDYYIINATLNDFQISKTIAGSAEIFDPTGTATVECKIDLLTLPSSAAHVQYRLASGASDKWFIYKGHIIIKHDDTLIYQSVYYKPDPVTGEIISAYGNEYPIIFSVDEGLDHDIIGLSQIVYPITIQ
jgi:hypothetical protein